jgi:hypothetical protein
MSRRPKIVGIAKSPTGEVHDVTDRVRRGQLVTACGRPVENGWGSPRKGQARTGCRNCLANRQRSAVA